MPGVERVLDAIRLTWMGNVLAKKNLPGEVIG